MMYRYECLSCGSEEIVFFEHHGPTGVSSEDGFLEYATESGVRCECGAVEDGFLRVLVIDNTEVFEAMQFMIAEASASEFGDPVRREAA